VAFTASALAQASGLRPQQASVALVALAAAGRAIPTYDKTRRSQIWRSGRRRIERRTLRAQRVGRNVYVSNRALVLAGLTEGSLRRTHTTHGVRLIIDLLRQPPRRSLSAWKVSKKTGLPRQTTEVVLAALAAAGVVDRELAGGIAWRWSEP
jgi:hypothetical protein